MTLTSAEKVAGCGHYYSRRQSLSLSLSDGFIYMYVWKKSFSFERPCVSQLPLNSEPFRNRRDIYILTVTTHLERIIFLRTTDLSRSVFRHPARDDRSSSSRSLPRHVRAARAKIARGCTRRMSHGDRRRSVRGAFGSRRIVRLEFDELFVSKTGQTVRSYVRTSATSGHTVIAPNIPRVSCLSCDNVAATTAAILPFAKSNAGRRVSKSRAVLIMAFG